MGLAGDPKLFDKYLMGYCGKLTSEARGAPLTPLPMVEKECAPEVPAPKRRKGVKAMYTDYGYIVGGVEYATLDEAYEATSE